MGLIYKVTNKVNGKEYVGQTTKTLKERKYHHFANKRKTKFSTTLKKYGSKNFSWVILWEGKCSSRWLNELEKFYIYFYDTYNKGYNLTFGGETSPAINPDVRKKMSKNRKGISPKPKFIKQKSILMKKKFDDENYFFGKILSNRDKKDIGKFTRGQKNGFYHKKHTKKTKEILSKKAKIRMNNRHDIIQKYNFQIVEII